MQIGQAEELLTQPATDYVRNFARDVQRDQIITNYARERKAQLGID